MIKVERTVRGIECTMDGKTFDLLAETSAAVEAMAHSMQRSAKAPMTFETALQHTIEAIYRSIVEKENNS